MVIHPENQMRNTATQAPSVPNMVAASATRTQNAVTMITSDLMAEHSQVRESLLVRELNDSDGPILEDRVDQDTRVSDLPNEAKPPRVIHIQDERNIRL